LSASSSVSKQDDGKEDVSIDSETQSSVASKEIESSEVPSDLTLDELKAFIKTGNASDLSNTQLLQLTNAGHIPGYALERHLEETTRAVKSVVDTHRTPAKTFTMPVDDIFLQSLGYVLRGVSDTSRFRGVAVYHRQSSINLAGRMFVATSRGCKAVNALAGYNCLWEMG
jgi:hypothetical protein